MSLFPRRSNRRLPAHLAAALIISAIAAPGWAANIAPIGTGIIGVNDAVDADAGTPRANAGTPADINDDDIGTNVDTWFGAPPTDLGHGNSFVGIVWPTLRYDQVENLQLYLATFTDGGWFGVNNQGPGPGGILTPEMLIEPSIQVTTDGGANWSTVPHTSDYLTVMNGHGIGGGGNANPTLAFITFTLDTPPTEIDGIRIIGSNGGTADGNGFLGVFELYVNAEPSPDTDGDGLPDNWEIANGFVVGTNEGEQDTDSDGLPNTAEYAATTDPREADTDGDGLNDGQELSVYFTNPLLPDTDGDGLTDSEEVNTHNTNPAIADSDLDGLNDYDEVTTHNTNPLLPDTDFDGFADNLEVAQGSDPNNALSIPNNLALLGRAIMGVKDSLESGPETELEYAQAGVPANLNDGILTTRADTFNGTNTTTVSYAGIIWDSIFTNRVEMLRLHFATFLDGGWFGPNGTGPGAGGALTADHLTEPMVQISEDYGFTWTTVGHTSDYIEALTGHRVGEPGVLNPTTVVATFTLDEPMGSLTGIRVIGTEGGQASGGFLGLFEFEAVTPSSDTDEDLLDDAWERQNGLVVGTDDSALDPDEDGLTNLEEYTAGTDPQNADSDSDGLDDAAELDLGTDPVAADTDGDTLSDGDEVNTHNTDPLAMDTDEDGFNDGLEVAQGTNPDSASSFPNNIAPLGTGIIGTTESIESGPYVPWANAGASGSVNDFNLISRVDTYNGGEPGIASYVGVLWDEPVTTPITSVELSLATFFDGGWFGVGGVGPGSGGVLTEAEHLVDPLVQVTTDGGTTWETVDVTSDYLEALEGHALPGVDFGPPTTATATFEFATPQTGIDGLRIIGTEGGTASGGFLGVFELMVRTETEPVVEGLTIQNAAIDGDEFSFEFATDTGVSYVVEFTELLLPASTWTTLTTVTGDGTVQQVTDSATEGNRFYRVRVE